MRFERLRERADFVALRKGLVARDELFTLQVSRVSRGDDTVRVGFTVTKKVGNAVVRNRIKRRLRHAARDAAPGWPPEVAGRDVVLIARISVLTAPYERLVDRVRRGVAKALQPRAKSPAGEGAGRPSP